MDSNGQKDSTTSAPWQIRILITWKNILRKMQYPNNKIQKVMNQDNGKALMNRRALLKGVGLGAATGSLGLLGGTKALAHMESQPGKVQKGNDNGPVKITKIESVRFNDKIDV